MSSWLLERWNNSKNIKYGKYCMHKVFLWWWFIWLLAIVRFPLSQMLGHDCVNNINLVIFKVVKTSVTNKIFNYFSLSFEDFSPPKFSNCTFFFDDDPVLKFYHNYICLSCEKKYEKQNKNEYRINSFPYFF